MKRISILLIVFAALFVACSKPNLQEKAISLLESSEQSLSEDASVKDVVLSNDSICVIQFLSDGKMMEYILISLSEEKDGLPAGMYEYTQEIDGLNRMFSVTNLSADKAFSKYEWSRFSKEDIEERPEMIYFQNALDLINEHGVKVEP